MAFLNKTKISINFIIILHLIFLFAISALNDAFVFLGLTLFAIIFIYLNLSHKDRLLIPEIVVALLLFQNFSIGIGAHTTGNSSDLLSLLTQIPSLCIGVSYLFVAIRSKIDKQDILFLIYFVICLAYYIKGTGTFTAKIIYLRNFTIFYMGYKIGQYYLRDASSIKIFSKYFINLSIVAGVFGIIGLILGKSFYYTLGILEVYGAKQFTTYVDGLPGNFVTMFSGIIVNRLASFYYEPVNFSYFMALACLLSFSLGYKKLFYIFLLFEIMTFGKGGFLVFGIPLACSFGEIVLQKFRIKKTRKIIIVAMVVGLSIMLSIMSVYFNNSFGTYNHFYGIISGVEAIKNNPLGAGLGTAGNLLKTESERIQDISETALINMGYQAGIIGATLFVYLLLYMSHASIYNYYSNSKKIYLVFSYVPMALLIASIFQENTLTPQCIIPYMLFQGALSNDINYVIKH